MRSGKITRKNLEQMISKGVKEGLRKPLISGHPEDAHDGVHFPNVRSSSDYDKRGLPKNEFSFVRFAEGCRSDKFNGLEAEVIAESKALAWASGSSGGYFVGAEFLPAEFIENYGAAQICRQAGMRILPATGSPIQIPKLTSGVTTYWVSQNDDITLSDITPGQLELTPKICAARSKISKTLFQTSAGSAESIIMSDMALALGRAVDSAVMEGSGAAGEPTGMAETAGINTVSASSGAITIAMLRDMELDLQTSDVRFAKPAFLMNPRTWHTISEIEQDSKFIFSAQPERAVMRSIFGYPVYLSTAVSTTNGTAGNEANVFLVDMDDIILCEWSGIELDATDIGDDAWKSYAVQFRGIVSLDVGVRNATSICLISDTTS